MIGASAHSPINELVAHTPVRILLERLPPMCKPAQHTGLLASRRCWPSEGARAEDNQRYAAEQLDNKEVQTKPLKWIQQRRPTLLD